MLIIQKLSLLIQYTKRFKGVTVASPSSSLSHQRRVTIFVRRHHLRHVTVTVTRYWRWRWPDVDEDAKVTVMPLNRCAYCMLACNNRENSLQNIVEFHGVYLKRHFTKIKIEDINDFPKLDIEILKREITFGSFQLKFWLSYLNGFLKRHGSLFIFTNKQVLRLNESKKLSDRVLSRLSSSKHYRTYVKYLPVLNQNSTCKTSSNIQGWKCECKKARTLGCCCHVSSIISYLFNGRYQPTNKEPFEFNNFAYSC